MGYTELMYNKVILTCACSIANAWRQYNKAIPAALPTLTKKVLRHFLPLAAFTIKVKNATNLQCTSFGILFSTNCARTFAIQVNRGSSLQQPLRSALGRCTRNTVAMWNEKCDWTFHAKFQSPHQRHSSILAYANASVNDMLGNIGPPPNFKSPALHISTTRDPRTPQRICSLYQN